MSAALLLALGFGAAGVSILWIVDAAQKRTAKALRPRGKHKREI